MSLNVLIVDDERAARYGMAKALSKLDCAISEAEDGRSALVAMRAKTFDLVFLDLNMPLLDGASLLREIAQDPTRPGEIVVVTADDTVASAVACMRLGASDYLTKPYEIERLRAIAQRNLQRVELENRLSDLQTQLDGKRAFGALIGVSRAMRELYALLPRAARAPLDILIHGETGTGKELIAKAIHNLSERREKPFVAVNSAAINDALAESYLFGHVKGAFTGAESNQPGVFEQADGGTLFLDEIGDMPLPLQAKMLRALQERSVQALGAARAVAIDVRIVCATHQDLPAAIAQGRFREDLYYRIKGIELWSPPLRERGEDIPLLADYFLERLAQRSRTPSKRLSSAAVQRLLQHSWPGNVRELQQVISAAGAMSTDTLIGPAELGLAKPGEAVPGADIEQWLQLPLTEAKAHMAEWLERRMVETALEQHDHNVSAAARQLGLHRQSLQQKMTQLGIKRGLSQTVRETK